jgi:hypothetical protein
MEKFIADRLPDRFNAEGALGKVDKRSPEKGPEPEAVVVGRIADATYAFVGLERPSAIAIFDISQPANTRLLNVVPLPRDEIDGGPHIAPEGLCFVSVDRSPTGEALLAVACEVSGTTVLFRVRDVSGD